MATYGNTTRNANHRIRNSGTNSRVSPITSQETGWVTAVEVLAQGVNGTGSIRALMYNVQDASPPLGPLEFSGPNLEIAQIWNWRRFATPAKRVAAGAQKAVGAFANPAGDPISELGALNTGAQFYRNVNPSAPGINLDTFENTAGTLAAVMDVVPNQVPTVGVWESPTPQGQINTATPTFQGQGKHLNGDAAYDFSTQVRLQIFEVNGPIIVDETINCDASSRFSFKSPLLKTGVQYGCRFQHVDSWNEWSVYTDDRLFSISDGPDVPSPVTPTGKVDTAAYNYSAVYTHPSGTQLDRVELEVWNEAGATRVYPAQGAAPHMVDLANQDSGTTWSIPRFHSTPAWGTKLTWRARVWDAVGLPSGWMPLTPFRMNQRANPPSSLSPTGSRKSDTGTFTAVLSDPDNDPITGAELEIVDVGTNVPVYNSPGWLQRDAKSVGNQVRPSPANGFRYVATTAGTTAPRPPVWPTALNATVADHGAATAVTRNRVCSTGQTTATTVFGPHGNTSVYYVCTVAGTTHPTVAPEYSLTPGDTILDGTAQFVCRGTITWRNAGGDQNFPMDVAPGSATVTLPQSLFSTNREYKWRARATDGHEVGYSPFSGYSNFIFASAPVITLLTPYSSSRFNLVRDPSAEYETDFWTVTGQDSNNTMQKMGGVGADTGDIVWRFTTGDVGDMRFQSPLLTIDASKHYQLLASFKKRTGATIASMRLLCYNSSGTFISSVTPQSWGTVSNTDLPVVWQQFGGLVRPIGSVHTNTFPAGTTQVRIEVQPSLNSFSVVDLDSIMLEQIPSAPSGGEWSTGEWSDAKMWFGYFDASQTGYGEDAYRWTGAEGNSSSRGIAVLAGVPPAIRFTYFSSVGNAKGSERFYAQYWQEDQWFDIYDPGDFKASSASSRTINPPADLFKNEGRYRIRVQVRDVAGNVGETDWIEFDVRFIGPAELEITSVTEDVERGILAIEFNPTTLGVTEFGGIEIAKEAPGEPLEIVHYSQNQNMDSYEYHFPVSGREYDIMVRQIRNVGVHRVQGKWERRRLSVDYTGRYFLKSVTDPVGTSVAFRVLQQSPISDERDRPGVIHEIRGRREPMVLFKETSSRDGAVDALIARSAAFREDPEARRKTMEDIERERPTVCFMSSRPEMKVFGALFGPVGFITDPVGRHRVSFTWKKTAYTEDVYTRDGVR